MKAIWSDDSYSSLSDKKEYVANMCFMEIESENKVQSPLSSLLKSELIDTKIKVIDDQNPTT